MNNEPDNTSGAALGGAHMLVGLAASPGSAAGPVYLFRTAVSEQIPEYRIEPGQVDSELARLADASALTKTQIHVLASDLKKRIGGDGASIFDGHLMILEDPVFVSSCKEKVAKGLCNAEAAVKQVADNFQSIFAAMDDAYLRERTQDVGDIAKRIIRNLSGGEEPQALSVKQPCIVVADELSPSETIALPKNLILGFATDRGSMTSHASLLACALGIPAVAGLGSLSEVVKPGDLLLLDGTHGKVVINPGREERAAFEEKRVRARMLEKTFDGKDNATPGQTLDGHAVPFLANADSSTSMTDLHVAGAEGIGLYRTEYLWLKNGREPSGDEQAQIYAEAARAMSGGQSVTIRVLDLGGDKMTKGFGIAHKEANPFLGNRSIRYLLRNLDVFRRQLCAVLRASAHGNVRIMYPMIATIDELHAANLELHGCMAQLKAAGVPFNEKIQRGVMVETPAAALIAGALAKSCDFFSIGTNDLIQYTLAVDRVNETVAQLYQPTHHAVLQLMAFTIQAAHMNGLKVSVCGEAATDPVMAVLFVGMGVDELSMSPNFIRFVKRVMGRVSLADARAMAQAAREMNGVPADKVYAFCRDQVMKLVPDLLSVR